jgi:glycosyltransferase involved in cell wall biosynthesis
MTRIAIVTSGLYFDRVGAVTQLRFRLLSEIAEGDVFCVAWDDTTDGATLGRFKVRARRLPDKLSGFGMLRSMVRTGLYAAFVIGAALKARLRGARPYDLIISMDPLKSGLLALLMAKVLGCRYAVEVNGNYQASMSLVDGSVNPWFVRRKAALVTGLMPVVLRHASAIKLLYESQLDSIREPGWQAKICTFHDVVSTEFFKKEPGGERYLLLLGYPWFLKGVDILIAAFQQISAEFPDVSLKIVGWCTDPAPFIQLAAGHPRIQFFPAGVAHSAAVTLINRCEIMVLPSRTEAMGRVLLEAMAASRPVIGARVDGIPRVVQHGENGLLFTPEDVEDLAVQLRRLLSNPDYAAALGARGKEEVASRLSPQSFLQHYRQFIRTASGDGGSAVA